MRTDITPEILRQRLQAGEALTVVDVRSPSEFEQGHVPGALNIPLDTFGEILPGVDPAATVILICHSGGRSNTACQRLEESYREVINVAGGTSGWITAGYPVEV